MASIITDIEHGIEVGAEDLLKILTAGKSVVTAIPVSTTAKATIGTLLGAFSTAATDTALAAANPLNIVVDIQTAVAIKAAIEQAAADWKALGIKL